MDGQNDGVSPTTVILVNLANVLLDYVGIIFFGTIVFITIKQKNLHSACHLLIGLYFLCGLCSKMITTLPFILANVPQIGGTVPLYVCTLLHLIPTPLTYGIFTTMFTIGVDRMLAIYCPIWYGMGRNKKYFLLQLLISSSYPLYIFYIILANVIQQPTMPSNCFGIESKSKNSILTPTFVGLTLFCYLLIFVKILAKRSQGQSTSIFQAIIKSLALIIFLQIGCWICTSILMSVLGYSAFNLHAIFCFTSTFTNAEMPLLYFTSSEHRLALEKQFPRIFRPSNQIFVSSKNKILVSTVANPQQSAIGL